MKQIDKFLKEFVCLASQSIKHVTGSQSGLLSIITESRFRLSSPRGQTFKETNGLSSYSNLNIQALSRKFIEYSTFTYYTLSQFLQITRTTRIILFFLFEETFFVLSMIVRKKLEHLERMEYEKNKKNSQEAKSFFLFSASYL